MLCALMAKTDVFSCFMHIWVAFTRSRRHVFTLEATKKESCQNHKLGWFLFSSLPLIIFSVACVCLDGGGGGGVSTAMHTLSGLLTGSENYLASLEIF